MLRPQNAAGQPRPLGERQIKGSIAQGKVQRLQLGLVLLVKEPRFVRLKKNTQTHNVTMRKQKKEAEKGATEEIVGDGEA